MCEGHVPVCDILKPMDFLFLKQQACRNGMYGSVAPSLVVESTILIESLEEIKVSW